MKTIDELAVEADDLLKIAKDKIDNCVTKEYLDERLHAISKDLEEKYKPTQMRLRIFELLMPYFEININNPNMQLLIEETDKIYNYIMKGKENEKA